MNSSCRSCLVRICWSRVARAERKLRKGSTSCPPARGVDLLQKIVEILRFGLLERRSTGRGTLEYRISEQGMDRLRWLRSHKGSEHENRRCEARQTLAKTLLSSSSRFNLCNVRLLAYGRIGHRHCRLGQLYCFLQFLEAFRLSAMRIRQFVTPTDSRACRCPEL